MLGLPASQTHSAISRPAFNKSKKPKVLHHALSTMMVTWWVRPSSVPQNPSSARFQVGIFFSTAGLGALTNFYSDGTAELCFQLSKIWPLTVGRENLHSEIIWLHPKISEMRGRIHLYLYQLLLLLQQHELRMSHPYYLYISQLLSF